VEELLEEKKNKETREKNNGDDTVVMDGKHTVQQECRHLRRQKTGTGRKASSA
jgi:hypothetical protein